MNSKCCALLSVITIHGIVSSMTSSAMRLLNFLCLGCNVRVHCLELSSSSWFSKSLAFTRIFVAAQQHLRSFQLLISLAHMQSRLSSTWYWSSNSRSRCHVQMIPSSRRAFNSVEEGLPGRVEGGQLLSFNGRFMKPVKDSPQACLLLSSLSDCTGRANPELVAEICWRLPYTWKDFYFISSSSSKHLPSQPIVLLTQMTGT